jgi:murein DD-endopeptidase MepM/ murein hydrolase activator NlpD
LSEEKLEILSLFGKTSHDFSWPVTNGTVTSAYGLRPKFVIGYEKVVDEDTDKVTNGRAIYSKDHHDGIDIVGNKSLVSIEKGYVHKVLYDDTFGNNVFNYHGGGVSSRYCHLESVSVKEKQIIEKGASVGVMGKTGKGTGVHLHFEIRSNFSVDMDPGAEIGTAGVSLRSPNVYISGGTFKNKME